LELGWMMTGRCFLYLFTSIATKNDIAFGSLLNLELPVDCQSSSR
jgi:hypothetical protein